MECKKNPWMCSFILLFGYLLLLAYFKNWTEFNYNSLYFQKLPGVLPEAYFLWHPNTSIWVSGGSRCHWYRCLIGDPYYLGYPKSYFKGCFGIWMHPKLLEMDQKGESVSFCYSFPFYLYDRERTLPLSPLGGKESSFGIPSVSFICILALCQTGQLQRMTWFHGLSWN